MLLLIIVLLLLFGGGGGYYGYSRWGGPRWFGNSRDGAAHCVDLIPARVLALSLLVPNGRMTVKNF